MLAGFSIECLIYKNKIIFESLYTTTTDIKSKPSDEKQFLRYPNPVNDKLTVSLKQGENVILKQVNMEVRDIYGRVVIKKEKRTLPYDIDASRLQQGIYFVHIENRYIFKFIKTQ